MLFLVPGIGETLRVNGTARVVTDSPYLPQLTVAGVTPRLAVEITVRELFLHCSKAFARSAVWEPASWPPADQVPSAGQIVRSQRPTAPPADVIDAALRHDARVNRY
jgi:predicted pyridoxine 5'-phosphate oxidase superfamily flavin-nucleotide-binding protein